MATKLHGGTDRDQAHRKLAEILKKGTHPTAECREDIGHPTEPFTVWSGPVERVIPEAAAAPAAPVIDFQMDALADRVAARILERMKG